MEQIADAINHLALIISLIGLALVIIISLIGLALVIAIRKEVLKCGR